VTAVAADSAKLEDLGKLTDAVKAAGGKIDFLFVDAGIALFAPMDQVMPDFFDRQFNVNVRGAYFALQALAPCVVDGGSIAVNATVVKDTGFPGSTVYSATKAALAVIAKTMKSSSTASPPRCRQHSHSSGLAGRAKSAI
jgi:NAD(P)-dependent dehydrogenase (short-subunit alcohol dehydrogenase family)